MYIEIKCFIGILRLSGYNLVTNKKFCWDTQMHNKNELIANVMMLNRFGKIL